MARARDIEDAAYNHLTTFDRNVWESDEVAPFGEVYVERAPTTAGAPPSVEIKKALLKSRAPLKVFLTGQRGSGKSMEVRRLHEDKEIAATFEHVGFVVTGKLNPLTVTMPELLVALAATVAEHIADKKYDKDKAWKEAAGPTLRKWIEVLPKIVDIGAPDHADWAMAFKIPIAELSARLREDVDLRARVVKQDLYSVTTLTKLVEELLGMVEHFSKRHVLVTIDDGDKIALPNNVRDVFLQHVDAIVSLPCRAVITFPYWLHFEKEWNPIALQNRVVVLQNVKVVDRADRTRVLPAAYDFFHALYDRLIDPSVDLADDEVLREAMRLSAGIPREFIRVLQKTFELGALRDAKRVTRALLDQAVVALRLPLMHATQTSVVRKRLMDVQRSELLVDGEDWYPLSSLLLVEQTDEKPWYAVHPLLQPEVGEWIAAEARQQAVLVA